jgi:formate hydrogenlyase subunit 3/multisubunit Na+/H+ antiporter MnhD subunit
MNVNDTKYALRLQPLASTGLIIGGLSVIGAPLLPIFMSKIMILVQLSKISNVLLVLLAVLFMLAASAFAHVIGTMLTNVSEDQKMMKKVKAAFLMNASVVLLIVLLLLMGIRFPDSIKHLLDTITAELRL